ncbi:AAA family ATPase [Streptomyces sp. NPDC126514]|uniref:helix-turn-helix transcriptional regulator n=1 Tax=Streptomyces sp. NPDC126514 TaxID=3155210 RepID=UPI003323A0AF
MGTPHGGAPEPRQFYAIGETFVGREPERSVISEHVQQAVSGVPWLIVVEGEPGIGKTSLVRRALDDHEDVAIWSASGAASEQDLSFGVLDQLLRHADRNALAQQTLISGGLPAGAATMAVGMELVEFLAAEAEKQPLVLVIDDVQWVDDESLTALALVLRRMWTERILLLVTARVRGDPSEEGAHSDWARLTRGAAHVKVLRLSGLSAADVHDLAQASGTALSSAAAWRLWMHTAGHPLYVRALLADVTAMALADTSVALPVPASLAEAVQQQLSHLPRESRDLLEALAVLNRRVPLALAGTLSGVGNAAEALEPALAAGLVQWSPTEPATPVVIGHALFREAIYACTAAGRRKALHGAATLLVDENEGWLHRVAAADHIDPVLVAELENEAARRADVSPARAATLLLWASSLADSRPEHDRLMLTAVAHLELAGLHDRSLALHQAVRDCEPSPLRQAILGSIAMRFCRGEEAEHLLAEAVRTTSERSTRLVISAWLSLYRFLWGDRQSEATSLLRRVLAEQPTESRARTYAWYYLALLEGGGPDGPRAGAVVLEEVLPALCSQVRGQEGILLAPRGMLRGMAGDLQEGISDLVEAIRREPAGEMNGEEAVQHAYLSLLQMLAGKWKDAAISADQARALAGATEQIYPTVLAPAVAAAVAAAQGRWAASEGYCAECAQRAERTPPGATGFTLAARAAFAQAKGDYDAMAAALEPISNVPASSRRLWLSWWSPLLVEALIATSRLPQAEAELEELAAAATTNRALVIAERWLSAALAAARGQLELARGVYEEGLALPVDSDSFIPLHRSQLEHGYAQLLLRCKDTRLGVQHLRSALDSFSVLGAVPFAQRVREDLDAISHHPALNAHVIGNDVQVLSERERSVSNLAAEGCTNREIAMKLFISTKTVEYHLSRVYTKLEITSRRQLRDLLSRSLP